MSAVGSASLAVGPRLEVCAAGAEEQSQDLRGHRRIPWGRESAASVQHTVQPRWCRCSVTLHSRQHPPHFIYIKKRSCSIRPFSVREKWIRALLWKPTGTDLALTGGRSSFGNAGVGGEGGGRLVSGGTVTAVSHAVSVTGRGPP